jgi:uncharacterized protein
VSPSPLPQADAAAAVAAGQRRRAWWLKTLHQWHWVSASLCLVGMLLFAVTGITLNHASQIEAAPQVTTRTATLPAALLAQLAPPDAGGGPVAPAVRQWLSQALQADLDTPAARAPAEWSPEEAYLALPRPGGDAWLRIARDSGEAEYELTDRGWVSYLNDLHKGRHAGTAWSGFLDVFALACLVFAGTGLFILKLHAEQRPATWPLAALGLVAPLLLALLFIH